MSVAWVERRCTWPSGEQVETADAGVGTADVSGVLGGLEAELAALTAQLAVPGSEQPLVFPPLRCAVFTIGLAANATANANANANAATSNANDGGNGGGDAEPMNSSGRGKCSSEEAMAERLLGFADEWDARCERAWEAGHPDEANSQRTLAQFWSELS